MTDLTKNVLIGLFALAAFAIILFALLFLNPSTGDKGQVIYARFANIDKINVGTRVNYAGKPVGEVVEIRPLVDGEQKRLEHDGHLYIWELVLRVDSHIPVYENDIVELRTSGLLGEKSVAITPMPLSSPQTKPTPLGNHPIYARELGGVEDALEEVKTVASKFSAVLDAAYKVIDDFNSKDVWTPLDATIRHLESITAAVNQPEQLHSTINNASISVEAVKEGLEQLREKDTWNHIGTAAQNFESITTAVNKPEELSQTVDNLYKLSDQIEHSWSKVDSAINHIAAAAEHIQGLSQTSQEMVVKVSQGEGTLGQIVARDSIYLQLSAILSKAETVMDDINHYGLLFHLDKGWQRLRARRANLLQKLATPQEFHNYFSDEMDQITTALARVTAMMQKMQALPCRPAWADNPDFVKVFAELLRRSSTLDEQLQMVNQQVADSIFEKQQLRCCP